MEAIGYNFSKSNIKITSVDKQKNSYYFNAFNKQYVLKFIAKENKLRQVILILLDTGEIFEFANIENLPLKELIFSTEKYNSLTIEELNKNISIKLFFNDDSYIIESEIPKDTLFSYKISNSDIFEFKLTKSIKKSEDRSLITFHSNYIALLSDYHISNHFIKFENKLSSHNEIGTTRIQKLIEKVLGKSSAAYNDDAISSLNRSLDEQNHRLESNDKLIKYKDINIKQITKEISLLEESLKIMRDEIDSLKTFTDMLQASHIINNTIKLKVLFKKVKVLNKIKSISKIYCSKSDDEVKGYYSQCCSKSALFILIEDSNNDIFCLFTEKNSSVGESEWEFDESTCIYLISNFSCKRIEFDGMINKRNTHGPCFGLSNSNSFYLRVDASKSFLHSNSTADNKYINLEAYSVELFNQKI